MRALFSRFGTLRRVRRATTAFRYLRPYVGASRFQLGALSASAIASGLLEAALLAVVAETATALSFGNDVASIELGPLNVSASLTSMFAVAFGLVVVRTGTRTVQAYLPARLTARAMAELRTHVFETFTAADWTIQSQERDGHLQSMMGTHVSNASSAILMVANALGAFITLLTLLASAFVLSISAAAVLIVSSVGLFFLMRPISKRTKRYAAELSEENIEYSKGLQEIVQLAEETQVFGASDEYREDMHNRIENVRRPLMKSKFIGGLVGVVYQALAISLLLVALLVIAVIGRTEIASLGAVVLILVRSLSYGQQLQTSFNRFNELIPFMDRLRRSLETYKANRRDSGSASLRQIERIELRAASYSYVEGEEVLSDLSFQVSAGEAVGIVGPSGAGKSTLVQILLRLRDPDTGRFLVNGEPATQFQLDDWQRLVAYVAQEPRIFYGTVADNIRYYRPFVSWEDVERSAKLAHIHDEIMSWRDGYETVIGQRASAVSGGQRQRICLARALAAHPSVLVLDEPTSALDMHSEALIQRSLETLIGGDLILFMVAHRLSTLSICSRIIVMNEGRIEAIDAHQQLMHSNAFYREAVQVIRDQTAV